MQKTEGIQQNIKMEFDLIMNKNIMQANKNIENFSKYSKNSNIYQYLHLLSNLDL